MTLDAIINETISLYEDYRNGVSAYTNARAYAQEAMTSLQAFKQTDTYTKEAAIEEKSVIDAKLDALKAFLEV